MRSKQILATLLFSAAAGCGAAPGTDGPADDVAGQSVESASEDLTAASLKVHTLQGAPTPLPLGPGSAASPSNAPTALGAASAVSTGNGIGYGGGRVMSGTVNVYYIWYGNWAGSSTVNILTDLAQQIGGSGWMNITNTYGDNAGNTASSAIHYAGSTTDNYSKGKSLSSAAVSDIVNAALVSSRLPRDTNGVYFVLSSSDVKQNDGSAAFCTNYCGWHNHIALSGSDIKYAFVGDPTSCLSSCAHQAANSPNGNPAADGMASVLAHELTETVTDPALNAWGAGGPENADLCAWSFGATRLAVNGSQANVHLGSRDYLLQQNWVNQGGGYCGIHVDNTDVGVFAGAVTPSAKACPGHEQVTVHMDDEDSSNNDSASGWHGISTTSDTTLQFCKVSGDSFKPLASGKPYAVLKLGNRCPSGSQEFTRYFDNEDDSNRNSTSQANELLPNTSSDSATNLHFCLFSSGTPTMTAFPEVGLGTYGVMSAGLAGLERATGSLRSDDEDSGNNDSISCGNFCSTAASVIAASDNTTMYFAEVAACDGAANGWAGCRGTGCFVCSELVSGYPNYFRNHPNCISNSTCGGSYGACNANCPAPSNLDR